MISLFPQWELNFFTQIFVMDETFKDHMLPSLQARDPVAVPFYLRKITMEKALGRCS